MVAIPRFSAADDIADMAAALDAVEAIIVEGFLTREQTAKFRTELAPILDAAPDGGDSFSGYKTRRAGALIARSPQCRLAAVHPILMALADHRLSPFSSGFQISLTQAVNIGPGEGGQILHRDRGLWGGHIPRRIETQLGTMIALTDFTEDNGATRVVPGSHKWAASREPEPHEIAAAEMPAGSILIYSGTVIHGGGANKTDAPRLGVLLHYTLNWLRQQENQYLSCPPEIAAKFTPQLRRLLGYSQGSPVMGFYSSPTGEKGREAVPPELMFGDEPSVVSERVSGENVVDVTKGR